MIEYIDKIISGAERLGSLSAATIFALATIAQALYIYKKSRLDAEETIKRLQMWEGNIRAEEHQTEAIKKLVESIVIISNNQTAQAIDLREIRTILNERLPQKV